MPEKKQTTSQKSDTPAVPLTTHTVDQLYLYAFATQKEVNNYMRTRIAKDSNPTPEAIIEEWRQVQLKVKSVIQSEQGLAGSINFENLDPAEHDQLKRIAKDPILARNYFATSIRFALVDVDRLIAPQRHVNLDHVGKIQSELPKKASMTELIDICLSRRAIEPVQHLEVGQNFHVFSSPSGDLRFLGAFRKDLQGDDKYPELGGMAAAGVMGTVGYGSPEVNVYEVGNKMILNNGFHRVYALRQMGYKQLPVLVQEIKNPSLEIGGNILGVASNYLLNHPRPVMLKDFFDEDFSIKLKVPKTIRTVKVKVMVEQYDVPA